MIMACISIGGVFISLPLLAIFLQQANIDARELDPIVDEYVAISRQGHTAQTLEDLLLEDDDPRIVAHMSREALPMKHDKLYKWQKEHSRAFNDAKRPWETPLSWQQSWRGAHALCHRECEVLLYHDLLDQSECGTVCDVSQRLERFTHSAGKMPTLTPSGRFWVRKRMRLLAGVEKLRGMGIYYSKPHALKALDDIGDGLIGDMAGNAFATRCCAAMLFTLYGALGYCKAKTAGSFESCRRAAPDTVLRMEGVRGNKRIRISSKPGSVELKSSTSCANSDLLADQLVSEAPVLLGVRSLRHALFSSDEEST